MYNILVEPLIRIDTSDKERIESSLIQVYVELMADRVEAFPALRPHQRHAWHTFLVQLGAMAMYRKGMTDPPKTAEEWGGLLCGLTPDWREDEPWQLVMDDITRPAFMQPPASSIDRFKDYNKTVATPDDLDILVVSKNHDLKSAIAIEPNVDDWIFALITVQTGSAQDGVGNYSVSRIRSAYSARPAFSIAPTSSQGTVRWGPHVRWDIVTLLERREEFSDNAMTIDNGIPLLWLNPWDGAKIESIPLSQLDHFFIEVCRRIRLRIEGGKLMAVRAGSKSQLVRKTDQGRTKDPWTPVDAEGLALNVGPSGLSYKRITAYLKLTNWPILLEAIDPNQQSDLKTALVARSLKRNTRKQGMTEGYAERVIPLSPDVTSGRGSLKDLGALAEERIRDIDKVQRILSHAIQTFANRGDSANTKPEHRERAREWLDRLDEIIDTRFFEALQTEFEETDAGQRKRIRHGWLLNDDGEYGVINYASDLLTDATDSLPCPTIYRYKARVNAQGLFEGRLRGNAGFPDLFL